MIITADMLREKNACSRQLRMFEKEWPDGVEPTTENLFRAAQIGLSIEWLATAFVPPRGPAFADYLDAAGSAWDQFCEASPESDKAGWAALNQGWAEAIAKAFQDLEDHT